MTASKDPRAQSDEERTYLQKDRSGNRTVKDVSTEGPAGPYRRTGAGTNRTRGGGIHLERKLVTKVESRKNAVKIR